MISARMRNTPSRVVVVLSCWMGDGTMALGTSPETGPQIESASRSHQGLNHIPQVGSI